MQWDLDFTITSPGLRLRVHCAWTKNFTGLSAPSGSGKSSFLGALLGALPFEYLEGTAAVEGDKLFSTQNRHSASPQLRPFAWVPQHALLLPHLNVRSNILLARAEDAPRQLFSQIVEELELQAHLDQRTETLSGGERQRVALARALLSPKPILLLDEPFNAQDDRMRQRAVKLLCQHALDEGRCYLLVTHNREEENQLCESFLTIKEGRLLVSPS